MNRAEIINGIKIPYDKDIEELVDMMEQSFEYFAVSSHALASIDGDKTYQILMNHIDDKDWRKRRIIVEVIAKHNLGKKAEKELIHCLSDNNRYVVSTVLKSISDLKLYSARERILELLESNIDEIKVDAIRCLGVIGKSNDIRKLIELHFKNSSKELSYCIEDTLPSLCSNDTWEDVFNVLSISELPRSRVNSCRLVSEFGSKHGLFKLKELENDKDGHVRKSVDNAKSIIERTYK